MSPPFPVPRGLRDPQPRRSLRAGFGNPRGDMDTTFLGDTEPGVSGVISAVPDLRISARQRAGGRGDERTGWHDRAWRCAGVGSRRSRRVAAA